MVFRFIEMRGAESGVADVRLNRPEIRNALDNELIAELAAAVAQLRADPRARCLVLRGAGPVFCAGGRVQWLAAGGAASADANLREIQGLVALLQALNELPLPVIAAIQGAAIGGGAGLASVADVVVCSAETVFSLSEARLGLVPSCIAPFVLQKIGPSWTRRFMLTGERFDAAAALAAGLAHQVVARPEALDAAVDQITESILKCAPQALRAAKAMLHQYAWPEARAQGTPWEQSAAEIFAQSRAGLEGQEGLRAFLEKRPPQWETPGKSE